MQNLQPQEVEILNEFQSRLLQCKKTKELLVLSPRAYIDKRIGEILASQPMETEDFQFSQNFNESKERDNSIRIQGSLHIDEPLYTKPNKNRLVVTSIKAFESNRKMLMEEQNKENKDNNKAPNNSIPKEKSNSSKAESFKKKKESSCENNKKTNINNMEKQPVNLGKKGEVKKICNKK